MWNIKDLILKEVDPLKVMRKAGISASTAAIGVLSAPALGSALANAGVSVHVDPSKLHLFSATVLAGLAGAIWNWFAHRVLKKTDQPETTPAAETTKQS